MSPEEAKKILEKSIITSPGINLQSGEVCYYAGTATAIITKNQNVGTTYTSFGGGLYGHGTGIHSNQGVRNVVRGTVVDQYPGHLYLTSRRVVLVTYKAGFDIYLSKLTGLDFYKDGLMVTSAGKSYLVSTQDVKKIQRIIEASNLLLSSNNGTAGASSNNSTSEKETISVLKEYKELLDGGVITQEEFDRKKQALFDNNVSQASSNAPQVPYTSSSPSKGKGSIGLWIGFVVMVFLAVFCLKKPMRINLFFMFVVLAIGFILHIDPLHLREQKKMLPMPIMWIICIVVAMAMGMLLR